MMRIIAALSAVVGAFSPPRASWRSRLPHATVLSDDLLARLCESRVVIAEAALDAELCRRLRQDALALRDAGTFVASKIGSRRVDGEGSVVKKQRLFDETRRSETCWLRPRPLPGLGDRAARDALDEVVDGLRHDLTQLGTPLNPYATSRVARMSVHKLVVRRRLCARVCLVRKCLTEALHRRRSFRMRIIRKAAFTASTWTCRAMAGTRSGDPARTRSVACTAFCCT